MQIWPAIDVRLGRCVRLQQGDFAREIVFPHDPVEAAHHWHRQGATRLHVVDLDGARDGRSVNFGAVSRIAKEVPVVVQLGGGLRDRDTVERALAAGVDRVVVGTAAASGSPWVSQAITAFPQRIAIGIDARDGVVATSGWLETTSLRAVDLARTMAALPIAAIIFTDIRADGMLQGPGMTAIQEMREAVDVPVIASGGVASVSDIQRLAAIGVDGVIIGRALYEGQLTLEACLRAAEENQAART